MLKALLLPVVALLLIYGFWASPDFKVIAAGLALFLLGMLLLEEGFKQFSGGTLERILRRSTRTTRQSLFLGMASTTIMQSSSLVSLITISFLGAGLMDLAAGIGIVFGANLGTTTGAWLIAGLGLKVSISAYAMPLLTLGVLFMLQSSRLWRGIGSGLAGLGLLFLGIHYMKEGFDAFGSSLNLASFATPGIKGLLLFTAGGILATVVLQSSHASMVLIITALAAQQVTYENALALAIGANVGTTITAIIGSLSAGIDGKRLAAAHLIFNVATGLIALILINQLTTLVDWICAGVGIAATDYTLKLAVFHTVFNLIGVILMTPMISRLALFLTRVMQPPTEALTVPLYLNEASLEVPAAASEAIRQELIRLYRNTFRLIAHGLSLPRGVIKSESDLAAAVTGTKRARELDIDEYYDHHIKHLLSEIVHYIAMAQSRAVAREDNERLGSLRVAGRSLAEAAKDMKHLHKNMSKAIQSGHPVVRQRYDSIRIELATLLREISLIEAEGENDALSFDAALLELTENDRELDRALDQLIRSRQLPAAAATSLMNDNGYAFSLGKHLIKMAQIVFGTRSEPIMHAEQQIALESEDLTTLIEDTSDQSKSNSTNNTTSSAATIDRAQSKPSGDKP